VLYEAPDNHQDVQSNHHHFKVKAPHKIKFTNRFIKTFGIRFVSENFDIFFENEPNIQKCVAIYPVLLQIVVSNSISGEDIFFGRELRLIFKKD